MTLAHNARGEFDQHAARELKLFIDNEATIFGPQSQAESVRQNLLRKIKQGTFDLDRSVQAWMYVVDAGAKKYVKDFGGGSWHEMFNTSTRRAVASDLAKEFYTEAKLGNYELTPRRGAALSAGHAPNRSPKPMDGYAYETSEHWQESSDEDWDTVMYTPTGDEKYVGTRTVDGAHVNVFRSENRYIAQLQHMTSNANSRADGHDYLVRKQHSGQYYLYSFDAWTDYVGGVLESALGYTTEEQAFAAAAKHAQRVGTESAVVARENADGSVTQVGNTMGSRYVRSGALDPEPSMNDNHKGLLRRNADLPRPRRTVDTSLSRVSRMEREQRQRDRPFDPEKRYPRGTKPHHFAINPTDPRDVPHHLRPVRVSSYRDDPEHNGQQVPYDTFENGTTGREGEPQWYEPEYTGGSDYSGGTVTRSNYQELMKMLEEHHPEDQKPIVWVDAHGGHGTYSLFVVYDELDDEIKKTLEALEDYPIIDEEAMSELENEEEEESWKNFYRREFERAVVKAVNAEYPDEEEVDDWPEDTESYTLLHVAMEMSNTYWEHTSEGPYLDLERIVPVAVDLITGAKHEPGHSVQDHEEIEKIRHGFDLELPK